MSLTLHSGLVAHVRHTPFRHRFTYSLWMLSLDIDELAETRLFHRNRSGLVSMHDADHGPRDGTPLRPWVENQLRGAGLVEFAAQVRLMAIPRVFGYAFNPISLFFCRNAAGQLGAVIHEVKNTFGDQTAYVLPVSGDSGIIRQNCEKQMHVSPFFDMRGGYRFAFNDPADDSFIMSLHYGHEDTPRMTATMRLARYPLTDGKLLRLLAAQPLMPVKVFAAIHWEALRLALRGARYHPVPPSHPALANMSAFAKTGALTNMGASKNGA